MRVSRVKRDLLGLHFLVFDCDPFPFPVRGWFQILNYFSACGERLTLRKSIEFSVCKPHNAGIVCWSEDGAGFADCVITKLLAFDSFLIQRVLMFHSFQSPAAGSRSQLRVQNRIIRIGCQHLFSGMKQKPSTGSTGEMTDVRAGMSRMIPAIIYLTDCEDLARWEKRVSNPWRGKRGKRKS